jgi:hypothetical protein
MTPKAVLFAMDVNKPVVPDANVTQEGNFYLIKQLGF